MNITSSFIIICIFILSTSCSSKPYAVTPTAGPCQIRSHNIFIVSHSWHTGIIIPGISLNDAVPELKNRFGIPSYYEIGWGDKGFYQSQEITTKLTLQAMFWSEGAVLHIVAFSEDPISYFKGEPIVSTCLTNEELSSLKLYILSSFSYSEVHSIIPLQTGIYGDSQFYNGEGRCYIFNTCNKWTAKALKSSGLQINPLLKLTASSIMDYLKNNRRSCTTY